MVRLSKIFLSLFAIGAILHGCVTLTDCDISGVTITLGEKFSSSEASDNYYTLSFITMESCDRTPQLSITGANGDEVLVDEPNRVTKYEFEEEKLGINYRRKSYFFFIDHLTVSKLAGTSDKVSLIIKIDSKSYGPFNKYLRNYKPFYPLRFFWTADMDISGNSTYTRERISAMDWGKFNGYIHTGDMAYEISDNNGKRGDEFFEELSSSLTQVPFLVSPGNHENYDSSRLLNYRFRMPMSQERYDLVSNNYYTVVIKNTQFFFINYDSFLNIHPESRHTYFELMKGDLEASSLDENIQWRVVMSHRPIYCSDRSTTDCFKNFYYLRPFESLYQKYKVNFHLASHVHAYERLKFLKDFKEVKVKEKMSLLGFLGFNNNRKEALIEDNGELIHIVNGCGGTVEWFFKRLETVPLYQNFVAGRQCYSILNIDEQEFKIETFDSERDTLLDSMRLKKTMDDQGFWTVILSMAMFFIAVTVLVLCLIKLDKGIKTWKETELEKISLEDKSLM